MTLESEMLLKYKNEGPERGGIITKKGLVEFENQSNNPEVFLEFSPEDSDKLNSQDCMATWHTHPGKKRNLTIEDYYVFMNHSNLKHYIIGKDGIVCYSVKNGALINES